MLCNKIKFSLAQSTFSLWNKYNKLWKKKYLHTYIKNGWSLFSSWFLTFRVYVYSVTCCTYNIPYDELTSTRNTYVLLILRFIKTHQNSPFKITSQNFIYKLYKLLIIIQILELFVIRQSTWPKQENLHLDSWKALRTPNVC